MARIKIWRGVILTGLTLLILLALVWCNRPGVQREQATFQSPPAQALSIVRQPAAQTVARGSAATFTVAAGGSGALAYQWQTSADGATWTNVTSGIGVRTPTFTTQPASEAMDGWQFRVQITQRDGTVSNSVTSQPARLTVRATKPAMTADQPRATTVEQPALPAAGPGVLAAPEILIPPTTQTVTVGETATFVVTASATGSISYQWQVATAGANWQDLTDDVGAASGRAGTGSKTSAYTTAITDARMNGWRYRVIVRNNWQGKGNSVISLPAALVVNLQSTDLAIIQQPAAQSVSSGDVAVFGVAAKGGAALNYQWQVSTDNGLTWNSAAVGQNGATAMVGMVGMAGMEGIERARSWTSAYTTPINNLTMNGWLYRVLVSNRKGEHGNTLASAAALLQVRPAIPAPTITQQPVAQSAIPGQSATFSVMASGSGSLTYQWQVAKPGGNWVNVPKSATATASSYTTPKATLAMNGWQYRVNVANSGVATTSVAASLIVRRKTEGEEGIQDEQCDCVSQGAGSNCPQTDTVGALLLQRGKRKPPQPPSFSAVARSLSGVWDKTECVKDDNTGLIWEGKTASGVRAGSKTYTHFDSVKSGNGQKSGNSGVRVDAANADLLTGANTLGYEREVNRLGLCGFTDWRLPTVNELFTLVDFNAPAGQSLMLNRDWLPNSGAGFTWTSSALVGDGARTWVVDFSSGNVSQNIRSGRGYIRLVRGKR